MADKYHDRIQKFDSNGVYIIQWGEYGTGPGQLHSPSAVTVDENGNIYTVDSGNDRIQKFDSDGNFMQASGAGDLNKPIGIAAGNDFVYRSDGTHRILKFDLNGALIGSWGTYGNSNGQFDTPLGIAIDTDGFVYVADQENHRVQKFDTDGTFLANICPRR